MSLSRFLHRDRWDDERARELEAHLAIETDENIARGMSPDEARAAACRRLGNATHIREQIYDMNTIAALDTLWQDLRYGARLLRRNPGFAAVAILSLALGVGANTAIFQLLNAVRMRPLPVSRPGELAEIKLEAGKDGRSGAFSGNHPALTNPVWERIRDRQQAFSDAFAWGSPNFELSSGGESRRAQGLWVSGGFFNTLNVRAVLGRVLTPADDLRGCAAPPAVISYGFWQHEFGGSPSAIGRALTLSGHAYDIVGIAPAGFFGVEVGRDFDVAVPLCAEPFARGETTARGTGTALNRKDAWFLGVMGRLKPGWSLERATAHLIAISPPIFAETLPNYRPVDSQAYLAHKLRAIPAGTGVSELREEYESPLWLLLATAALVLLIACANLANLMLARATAREREIAVRLALGASRGRIVRQLLAESLLIAAAGAGAAAFVGQSLSQILVAALTTQGDRVTVDVTGDLRVFLFIALLAAIACAIFGLVPAVRATATSPGAAMKAGSRNSTDTRERFGLRRVLVVAQVALSLVLVVGALLFIRSFRNLIAVDAGFSQQNLVVARFDFRGAGLPEEALRAAYGRLLDRVRSQPGIDNAAHVRNVPIGGSFSNRTLVVDGKELPKSVNFNSVSDRYFSTMGTPLLAGRDFDARDTATTPRVTIVNEAFAREFLGGGNPIGRIFQMAEVPGERPQYEIVGMARDSKYGELRESFEPQMYVPALQNDQPIAVNRLIVRSRAPVANVTAAVTALARELHPSIVVSFRTIESQLTDSLLRERLMATLLGCFGALAAVLATIGLYGVMSYTVARRRAEIGIRMALGADRRQVIEMVMGEATRLLAIGLTVGVVAALIATRSASGLLFGLKPHDPLTLLTAAAALAAVAALASFVPALRASRLQPTEALRED
jgi:putative ABC transport system permease protein